MAQTTLGRDKSGPYTKNLCPQCGAECVDITCLPGKVQHFCPKCGANMLPPFANNTGQKLYLAQQDEEAGLPQDEADPVRSYAHHADTTRQVRPQDSDATIRVNPRDPDATVRASRSLSPALLKKAIEKSQEKDAHPLPESRGAIHSAHSEGDAPQFVALARKKHRSRKHTLVLVGCVLSLILILALTVTTLLNHNGEASAQQAQQSEAQLNSQLQQARALGVPTSYLQPVLTQEQQLAHAQPLVAPVNPFATGYYTHAVQQYRALRQQIPGNIATATNALQTQAQQNMQAFQMAISRGDAQGIGNSRYFPQQFSQDQLALSSAQYPRDYSAISQNAQQSIVALQSMGLVSTQLNDLKTTISRMAMAHLDVTALQSQYANDLQAFNTARSTTDFQNLSSQIDAQYEQTVAASIQAFPYVGVTKLNELQQQISQLQSYSMNTSYYQKRLSADQLAEQHVNTVYDALLFIKQVDNDISSMDSDLIKGEAHYLVNSFHQQVNAWAKAHPYYDSFNGHTYALDDGYMATGIGNTLDSDLAAATTTADYAAMVNEANNDLFDLHMFEADYTSHTPYNAVHATDTQMLNHYNLQGKQVLLVSLGEQVMRVYQNGKLVRAFYVTTGRSELPSPPGVWTVLDRRSPATFVSGEAKNSPYWFPPTPIQYAILYHYGGDFVHDAWWRQSFGPGTQFPHADAGGNTSYNFDGSHGCINLTTSDTSWVYKNTNWNTVIVVY